MFILRNAFAGLLLLSSSFVATFVAASPQSALDNYVMAPDAGYNYTPVGAPIVGDGYKLYILYMTSQQWRSAPQEVDRTLWTHWMAMIVRLQKHHFPADGAVQAMDRLRCGKL